MQHENTNNTEESKIFDFYVPSQIILDSRLNGNEKILLAQINYYDNLKGCTASNQTLSKYNNCTNRSTQYMLNKLAKFKLIKIKYLGNGNSFRTIKMTRKQPMKNLSYPPMKNLSYPHEESFIPPMKNMVSTHEESFTQVKSNINDNIKPPISPNEKYWGMGKNYVQMATTRKARTTIEIISDLKNKPSQVEIEKLKNSGATHIDILKKVNEIKQDNTVINQSKTLMAYFKKTKR